MQLGDSTASSRLEREHSLAGPGQPELNAPNEENPVMGPIARVELGKPGPPIGKVLFSAIKRAMGLKGKYVLVSEIRKWRREHPNFQARDVYPTKPASRPDLTHTC